MKVYLLVCGRDLHFPFNVGLTLSVACGPFSSPLFCAPQQDMLSLAFGNQEDFPSSVFHSFLNLA